jgi:hypothetical protein
LAATLEKIWKENKFAYFHIREKKNSIEENKARENVFVQERKKRL